MSVTLVLWLLIVAGLSVLTLQRAAYGVALYLFTFFVNPTFWPWGEPIENIRWNLLAALILLIGVALQGSRSDRAKPEGMAWSTAVGFAAVLMMVNAIAVHVTLAPKPRVSIVLLILLIKYVILYFTMTAAIRKKEDLRLVVWSVVLCASYIGYQATINNAGRIQGGRLENIGAAGVQNANELASLLLAVVPLGGYLFLTGTRREKILAALTTPLVLNVILLCNSRGALLALILAAITIVAMAPKGARRKVLKGLGLGAVALVLLLRDPEIVERFLTVFVDAEERDSSAKARMLIWTGALMQIRDYPFGAGGESFSWVFGDKYLPEAGLASGGRAVHNGYLNEATNWGIQGLFLRLLFYGLGLLAVRQMTRRCAKAGDVDGALLGVCLISATIAVLVSAVFGDYLDDDWGIWMVALMVSHATLYASQPAFAETTVVALPVGTKALPAAVSAQSAPN